MTRPKDCPHEPSVIKMRIVDVARLWGWPTEVVSEFEYWTMVKFHAAMREEFADLGTDLFGEGFRPDTEPPPKIRKVPVRTKLEPPPVVVKVQGISRDREIAGRIMGEPKE